MLKSGIYDFVICHGGTDMCFVLDFGRKRPDLKQYRISGLRPPERKPCLFNKRIILWGAEKCCRNVTAVRYDRRARRAERVGRSFVGIGVRMQLRRSRTFSPDAREGYRWSSGVFSSSGQPTCLYIDPSPPPLEIRVYLFAATPPPKYQFLPPGPSQPPKP